MLSALHHLILGRAAESQWLHPITLVVIVHVTYVGFVRLVERRPAWELSWDGAAGELGKRSPWERGWPS